MGFMWAILMPAVIVLAGVLVRYGYSIVADKPLELSDFASVSVRSIPWAFVVSAVRFGTNSLLSNTNLVTKIYFPKEVFPLAAVAAALFDFFIASCAITVVFLLIGVDVGVHALWFFPIMLVLVLQVAGFSLLFAAAGLFFRDVKYIVEIVLTFGIFFTPVFFSASTFGKFGTWLLYNPIAPLLESLDSAIVFNTTPDPGWFTYSAVFSLVIFVFGYRLFKQLEPAFAESI